TLSKETYPDSAQAGPSSIRKNNHQPLGGQELIMETIGERSRLNSSLIINGSPKYFLSGLAGFSNLLKPKGQVYFDYIRYISVLEIDSHIPFFRLCWFG